MIAAAIAMKKLSIQILVAVSLFILVESGRNDLGLVTDISGAACPGNVLTYECDIAGAGNTIWNGTAFYCPLKSNEIILRHSQFSTGTSGSCNDRTLIEVQSLGVINNCFSSELNITVTSDLNNKTIRCSHSSSRIVTIGEIRLSVATVPYPSPSTVRLAEVHTGELIFRWDESADRPTGLYYIINSTCGTCPNMSSTTIVTCSDLNVSTTLTTCTFSVQGVACGTIGSPSLLVMVNLAVPDIPDAAIIPQYSQNNGQLIAIIVRVKQNVTSNFSISDTVSGSTTNYHIFSSGSSVPSQPACMEDTCEYTFPPDCSGSSVDIAVAAANRLGLGPPSEPNTIECNNRFVKVEYDPSTATISCVFENELDLSTKSCSVDYGLCGKETNSVPNSTTEGSPSTVTLKLNAIATNSKYCYVVTARLMNNSLTVMVKGNFETQSSNNMGVIVGAVIGVIVGLILAGIVVTIVIVACFITRRREHHDANLSRDDNVMTLSKLSRDTPDSLLQQATDHDEAKTDAKTDVKTTDITDWVVLDVQEDVIRDTIVHVDCLDTTQIRSVQFKETKLQQDYKKDDLKHTFGQTIFVDYNHHSSGKVIDVMLKDKDGHLFSGTVARDMISQRNIRGTWEKVFVLHKKDVSLKKDEVILHQDGDQQKKALKFRVFDVDEGNGDEGRKLSEFLQLKKDKFDYARAYYEFSDGKPDLLYYREVMEVSNSKLKEAKSTGNGYIMLESDTDRGVHMFYKLKPQAPGANITAPKLKNRRCFVQSTPQDSDHCLKVGSLVLYEEDVDPESHR